MGGNGGNRDATRRWWILAAMGGSLGIVLVDEVLVGIALPTIRDELGLSQVDAQWVVNAYVLAVSASVAVSGRLGDLLGHRWVFIGGATAVGLGSLGAGLAGGGGLLIASRAVEGIGAATILSLSIAITGIVFARSERGAAVGIYGLIAAVPAAFAPIIGGVLTDLVSWRWIFFLNVPLVAVVIGIVAFTWRDADPVARRARLDLEGFGTFLCFVVPLVIALMEAPQWGWGSAQVLALFGASAVALVAFVVAERRTPDPVIDLGLLRPPSVMGANLVIFCAQFSKIAVLVYGALFLQDRLGLSAVAAGTALLAAMIPQVATGLWSGRLTDRRGSRQPMLAGVGTMIVALGWLAIVAGQDSYLLLVPGFLLWGLSLPFLFNPAYTTILNAVAANQRGAASGVTSTGRQLGGALAVAVLGAVLLSPGGFTAVFAVSAGVTVVVWIAAYLLIERPASVGRSRVAPLEAMKGATSE